MAKHMTWDEAMEAAEELMKEFERIDRERFERENPVIGTFDIETGAVISN